MSKTYTVKAGDYFGKIAQQHGFSRWQDIYNHPLNQQFRLKRPDPNRIFPGDVMVIPDLPGSSGKPTIGVAKPSMDILAAGLALPVSLDLPPATTGATPMPTIVVVSPRVNGSVWQEEDWAVVEVQGQPGLACYPYPTVTNLAGKDLGPMGNRVGKFLPTNGKAVWKFMFPSLPIGHCRFSFYMQVQNDRSPTHVVNFVAFPGYETHGGGV